MPSIRVLPERVANQIAAGEVVERPAAVVKELVENALDAGATRLAVEFRRGGRALIRVEDDGCGMGRDDAVLAFARHATSKISAAADLERLATFGFRGEALPSIASVSRCTLQTRLRGGEAGTEILIDGGRLAHTRDCGRAAGTSVEVAHLFHPVPARRKFLKTDRTEAAHIVHCVRLYALAHPGVGFTLTEDGRIVFRSPSCATLAERIAEIFGRQITAGLIPLEAEEEGMRLHGLLGRPGVARATRHEMVTFVNSRPVESRALAYALLEGYQQSLPKGRHPVAFLFLECDPAAVDVNVHPAKREIRFRDEPRARAFVVRSVLHCLREIAAAPAALPVFSPPPPAFASPPVELPAERAVAEAPAPGGDYRAARERIAPPAKMWNFIGLAQGLAVFETPAGIVLLDRRAAHERVWFERLRAAFEAGGAQGQRLLLPVPVELDPIAAALLLDRRSFLGEHGFEVADFGRNFFRIESIPGWMDPADAEPFLRDFLGAVREGRIAGTDLDVARAELARLAAGRAARLPPAAGRAELEDLLAELFATPAPLISPSGRPTCLELSRGELERRLQKRPLPGSEIALSDRSP